MNALFRALDVAAFGRATPEPQPVDHDAAEQFAADVTEAVDQIAEHASHWSLMVAEGRRSMPALNASEREDLLTRLWAMSETMKQMRSGAL